jgi:hypothetical protein
VGGTDATLDDKAALWNAQADTLLGPDPRENGPSESQTRLEDVIDGGNADGMHRAMRASKEARE